jgi:rubrerythrin
MRQYKVEFFQPTFEPTDQKLAQQVNEQLGSHAKAGWRLVSMTNVTGTGGTSAGGTRLQLLLVFESGEEDSPGAVVARKAPKVVSEFVCSDCGGDITEDAKVCPHCGAPIEEE